MNGGGKFCVEGLMNEGESVASFRFIGTYSNCTASFNSFS